MWWPHRLSVDEIEFLYLAADYVVASQTVCKLICILRRAEGGEEWKVWVIGQEKARIVTSTVTRATPGDKLLTRQTRMKLVTWCN